MIQAMRLGTTPYANARPLTRGLASEPDVELTICSPARLADLLRTGDLDGALVSSSEYFSGSYELIAGHAISASDAGADAVLLSEVVQHQLRRVALDAASRSTNLLLQVILSWINPGAAIQYELRPFDLLRTLADFDAALVIGDPALAARGMAPYCFDLAQIWAERTGLPMVLTVWLARPGFGAAVAEVTNRAAQRGQEELPQIIAEESARLQLEPEIIRHYLTEVLDYSWSLKHLASLELFGKTLRELGLSGARTASQMLGGVDGEGFFQRPSSQAT
jgi:chorismate dehydratase